VFSKKLSKFQQVFFKTTGYFTLAFFEKVLKNLVGFAVKPKQSIASTKQPIVFLKTLTKFC